MKLDSYITASKLTNVKFGKLVNLDNSSVSRLRRGLTLPSPAAMRLIHQVTEGLVTPNDFILETSTKPAEAAARVTA